MTTTVAEAIKQVSSLRGRLGAFQKNTVGATIRSLGVAIENTAAAQSVILMVLVIALTVVQFRFIERKVTY